MPSRPREVTQIALWGEERKYPDEKKIRWGGGFERRKIGREHGKENP